MITYEADVNVGRSIQFQRLQRPRRERGCSIFRKVP